MRRKNYNLKFLLLVSLALIIGVGIAYAALSTTLTITMNKFSTTASANGPGGTGPIITSCSKTNDVGTSATGRTCGAITVASGGKAVTVADTTLSKPGDGCVYKCTISNTHASLPTIPYSIYEIVPTAPTSTSCTPTSASGSTTAKMVCGNITYGIYATATVSGTTITTTNLLTGTAIDSNSTKDFYLAVQYTGTSLNSSAVTQSGGKFTFTLNQS